MQLFDTFKIVFEIWWTLDSEIFESLLQTLRLFSFVVLIVAKW